MEEPSSGGTPDISIVTTTFDRAHLLPRAWNSVRDEAPAFEWIVVDDNSTDDTATRMESFGDPRIRYVRHPVNRGGPAAGRNQGARLARGRYVVFLDDDDELFPGALQRMVDVMDAADQSVGCAMFQCVFPGGGRWNEAVEDRAVYNEEDVVCRRVLGLEKIFVYRRDVFEEFQLPEDLLFVEMVFVFSLAKRYRFLMVDEPGRVYHETGVRQTNIKPMLRLSPLIARGYERILRNHSDVLAGYPQMRLFYLLKALYRYNLAGERTEARRVFREILRHRRPAAILRATGLQLLGFLRLAPLVERVRLPLSVRRNVRRQTT